MRIAIVTETFMPEINGVAMTIGRLVQGLAERGHSLQVVRPRQNPHHPHGIPAEFDDVTLPGFPIPLYPEMRMGFPCFFTLLKLWKARRPDFVHIVTEGPMGLTAVHAARRLRIPCISSFHTNFHHYTHHYGIGFLYGPLVAYFRHIHNLTRCNLVPDATLITELEVHGFRNSHHWARGVDTELFTPARRDAALRQEWGLGDGSPCDDTLAVLHVSRVAKEKNIPLVVEVFDQISTAAPHARLVIVGDGPELPRLRKRYPHVIFTGMKLGEDLARHYASADLFLFASTTETFGNVVTESLASGLVTLTYEYAAGRQFIRPGENGYLAGFDNPASFADTARIAMRERHRWPAIRTAARATAEGIPWSHILDNYETLLKKL